MASGVKFARLSFLTYSTYSVLRRSTKSFLSLRACRLGFTSMANQADFDEEYDDDGSRRETGKLQSQYPGHIPTTMFQKALLTVGSAGMALYNPARDDMVSVLGETTGYFALRWMRDKMLKDPVGRQILEEQPVINTKTVSIPDLEKLPEGTFGKEYSKFLSINDFTPDARMAVQFVDDPDLMYVMLRYRQCHDLLHTLLGMPTNMLGEIIVKWVEAFQTGLPMCALGALGGPVRLGPIHRQQYMNIYLPWALQTGYNAKFLMAVYFEKHWEQDIEEFRQELNIQPAPRPVIKTGKRTLSV